MPHSFCSGESVNVLNCCAESVKNWMEAHKWKLSPTVGWQAVWHGSGSQPVLAGVALPLELSGCLWLGLPPKSALKLHLVQNVVNWDSQWGTCFTFSQRPSLPSRLFLSTIQSDGFNLQSHQRSGTKWASLSTKTIISVCVAFRASCCKKGGHKRIWDGD